MTRHHPRDNSDHHNSIEEKVYRLLVWLTDPVTRSALVLYGPMASGKTIAFWEAIEKLKGMSPHDRPIPMEVHLFTEGQTFMVYNLEEHHQHYNHHEQNILDPKTIVMVSADRLPTGMADLLCANVMKFEHE